jgi:hypothetical protein
MEKECEENNLDERNLECLVKFYESELSACIPYNYRDKSKTTRIVTAIKEEPKN